MSKSIMSFRSESSKVTMADSNEKYVQCPYDKSHCILAHRMSNHLLKCGKNHQSSDLKRCPFNSTHLLKPNEFEAHIKVCVSRKTYEHFAKPDSMPPAEPRASVVHLPTMAPDWSDEPPVPAYDPIAYCEKNPIIRNAVGLNQSKSRMFRESERKRINDIKK